MSANFTMRHTAGCLVVTPLGAMCLELNQAIRHDALARLQKGGIKALIIDFSGVSLIDSAEFNALYKTMKMAKLMGAKPLITGVHFGVASALAQMDIKLADITHTHTVDDALRILS